MVKSRTRSTSDVQIEKFASGAEIKPELKKISDKKFKRLTFSLTDLEDKLINELSLKPRTFRCNRSDVLKAAIHCLASLSDEKIIKILEKQRKS